MLDDLTINNAMNINHIDFNRLVGRRYPHKLPLMCTFKSLSHPHFITFCERISCLVIGFFSFCE